MEINEIASKQIYELKPLEMVSAKDLGIGQGYAVLRVPGGWVFIWLETSCFVPFDNEFQQRAKTESKKPARKKRSYVVKNG
jgi:hypothetical protein